MTPLEEVLLRVPVVVLLVYVPFLCYADLKWREIPPEWWAPAFLINIPIVAWFNYTGYFPPVVLVLSLVMCGIFWVLHMLDRFQGADFVFLVAISMSLWSRRSRFRTGAHRSSSSSTWSRR